MRAVLVLAGVGFAAPAWADPPKAEAVPAAVVKRVGEVKGADRGALKRLADEPLRAAFPQVEFAALQFRKYPSEIVPPPPLKANNVYAAQGDAVVRVSTADELSKFFVERFPAKADAKAGAEAFLRLLAALNQDGFYEFSDPMVKVTGGEAVGTIGVNPKTGKGELRVTLTFKDGKLTAATPGGELTPGRRPR